MEKLCFLLLVALCLFNVAAAYHVPHNAEIEDFDESSKSLEDLMKLEERLPRAKADEVGFLFLKYVTAEKLHEYVEGIAGILLVMFDGLPSESKISTVVNDNADFLAALYSHLNSTSSAESSNDSYKHNFEALRPVLEDRWAKKKVDKAINILAKIFPDSDSQTLSKAHVEGYIEFYNWVFKDYLSDK